MRILTLDYECNVPGSTKPLKGGTARFARDFRAYAVAQGHEWIGIMQQREPSETLLQELPSADKHTKFYAIRSEQMRITDVATCTTLDDLVAKFSNELATIQEALQALKPDVVFLNGFSQYSWALFYAATKENVPVAFQHAGLFVQDIQAFADKLPASFLPLAKIMEQDATEHVAANVFLNEHSYRATVEKAQPKNIPGKRIIPLPHAGWGFPEQFAPRASTVDTAYPVKIGVIARWDPIKNHAAVLALAKEIHAQNLPWEILSVTAIPETPAKAVFKKEYRSNITVVPYMNREELRAFYRTLDLSILPSHFETAGGTVMEALAEGVPTVVSPHVGWIDEYMATGMEAWIADFTDPASIVATIQQQLSRTSWPEVSAFAAHIKEQHDPEQIFSEYLSVFTRISSMT